MSGMVAVVAQRDASVGAEEVEHLAATYESVRGVGGRRSLAGGGRVHVIRVSRHGADAESGIETHGPSWAVSVGVPHHQGSLVSAPLDELDGVFALIRYDGERDEVVIASDPFGMQELYVAQDGSITYISTSALALAKHVGARASALDVFTYLRIGLNFGPNTHWEGIERLEPATRVRISGERIERSQYWRAPIDDAVTRLPFMSAVSHCTEALVETLRAYLSACPRAWCDLTGGFDTRLMALALSHGGVDFRANTTGGEEDDDVRIAARVAATAGWDWSRFETPGDWDRILPARLLYSLGWGDGLLDALQLSEVLWHHEQKSRDHRGLFIGGGGEHFRNFAWQQEFLRAGRSSEINWDNWLKMRLLPPIDISIFAHDISADVRADLRRRMEAWLEPYSAEPNTVKLDMLYAYKSTGHFGAYRSAASAFLDAQLPFYFKPVFIAATSSNFRFRNNHRLVRHMITSLDPHVATIETATGGPAEPWRATNLHRFAPYYARIARKVADKAAQKAFGRTLFHSGPVVSPRRTGARLAALDHLASQGGFRYDDLRIAPLLRRRGYEELIDQAGGPGLRDASLLGRILTAELALRETGGSLERQ
jgi:Glutamine amidotransferase domain